MRACVTGGTGFVGHAFVSRLLADGWEVSLLTRDRDRAARLPQKGLTVYQADVSDAVDIQRLTGAVRGFDVVFHLAASLSYFGDRRILQRVNVDGTRNVLELAIRSRARKFIYASSIEAVGPVSEADIPASPETPCRPVSSYGWSKARAESLVRTVAPGNFPYCILRIGNVYASDHSSFVLEIADAILRRGRLLEFLPVYANRCIQPAHNADVTEGLLAAVRSDVAAATVVLAGPHATLGDLFAICCEVLDRRLHWRPKSRKDALFLHVRQAYHRYRRQLDLMTYIMTGRGSRVHRAYSLEPARDLIGFSPRMALSESIRECLSWAQVEGRLPERVP